jgi:hypothetical protein
LRLKNKEAVMAKILDEWTVLPHGPVTQIDPGLWTVTGDFHTPLTHLQRRMTIVRLADGSLIIYSAMALAENEMRKIEEAGQPRFLVVPGKFHRTDARIWKQRYPMLKVLAPVSAREAAEEAVPVDATDFDFDDPSVKFITVGGTSGFEVALIVRRAAGTALIVNDIIGNMPSDAGFVLRLMRFAGDEPHIPLPIKMGFKDKEGLRDQLRAWADEPDLKRILMSHGDPIDDDPAAKLLALAQTLT